jgi:poly(3-hydroxybutyrate) depolymerase
MNAIKGTQMNVLKGLLAAVVVWAGVIDVASAATPVPSGRWSFVFADAKGRPDRPIRVYTYRGRKCDASCPILFVIAGEKRNAYDYLAYWELAADRYSFIVIAPEFSKEHWPKAAAYNLGDVADQPNREKWSFSAIEHLFDEVNAGQKDYMIFGHSAGGQFVQRMAFLRADNRASVMIAANPGWYSMPEWRKEKADNPYPYSLVNSPAGAAEVKSALGRRAILMLGENDSDPDSENLNKSGGAMKQGATRVERGENFFKAASAAAQELGVKLGWELIEVPDTAHDGAAMSKAAVEALFRKK